MKGVLHKIEVDENPLPPPVDLCEVDTGKEADPEGAYDTTDAPSAPGCIEVPVTELRSSQFVPS